jgi:hypothetical protein
MDNARLAMDGHRPLTCRPQYDSRRSVDTRRARHHATSSLATSTGRRSCMMRVNSSSLSSLMPTAAPPPAPAIALSAMVVVGPSCRPSRERTREPPHTHTPHFSGSAFSAFAHALQQQPQRRVCTLFVSSIVRSISIPSSSLQSTQRTRHATPLSSSIIRMYPSRFTEQELHFVRSKLKKTKEAFP